MDDIVYMLSKLTLPNEILIIIRRLWYTQYYNCIGLTTMVFSDVTHTMSDYAT